MARLVKPRSEMLRVIGSGGRHMVRKTSGAHDSGEPKSETALATDRCSTSATSNGGLFIKTAMLAGFDAAGPL